MVADQLDVRLFVAAVGLRHREPVAGEPQQVEVAQAEQLAPLGSPVLVAVVGQQPPP